MAKAKINKTDRIRYLCTIGLTNKEILPIVTREFGPTHPAYIRTVSGQRLHTGQSRADRKYLNNFVALHGCYPDTVRQRNRREEAFLTMQTHETMRS